MKSFSGRGISHMSIAHRQRNRVFPSLQHTSQRRPSVSRSLHLHHKAHHSAVPRLKPSRSTTMQREQQATRQHYTHAVSDRKPPDITLSPALAHAISTGSLAQLQSLLPSDIPPETDAAAKKEDSNTLRPSRAYLLYLATQAPYHPSILAHILSLYPPKNPLAETDPANYQHIDDFWRVYYSSYALEAAVNSNLPSMIAPFLAQGWAVDEEISSPHNDDVYSDETLLGLAVSKGLEQSAAYLLQCGADPNQQLPLSDGAFPRTLMTRAAELNDVRMLTLLRKHGGRVQGNMAMHAAAGEGSVDAMDWLVSEGALVGEVVRFNDSDELIDEADAGDGELIYNEGTPLHSAARNGSVAGVRYLLERGVDKRVKDWQGRTAVDVAEEAHKDEAADLIKQWVSSGG